MNRVISGIIGIKKKKKVINFTKGYLICKSSYFSLAKEQLKQSLNFSFIQRKLKKRVLKKKLILKINSILKFFNIKFCLVIGLLKKYNIFINKKSIQNFLFINLKYIISLIFFLQNFQFQF